MKEMLDYKTVLERTDWEDSHLLLWNGFNRWLAINTSYEAIFNKMMTDKYSVYQDAKEVAINVKYDLEIFIWEITKNLSEKDTFLRKYISNKIKLDFMKAAQEIVSENIKNVYTEKNQWIFILLQNFTNFFTLNYDPFIYLLLLKFKKSNAAELDTIGIQPSIQFQKEDIDQNEGGIYSEIQKARNEWKLTIGIDSTNTKTVDLSESRKWTFSTAVKEYFKDRNWKWTEVNKVISKIWEDEKSNPILSKVDDWFKTLELFPWSWKESVFQIEKENQNLFFLHWAFHIYQDWDHVKKITQRWNEALYNRLEDILNNEDQNIITVFKDEGKLWEIQKSPYLSKCYGKLWKISWNLVVIWCSFWDNDKHITEQIQKSSVSTLYISWSKNSYEKSIEKFEKIFPWKNIFLFDYKTINYEISDKCEETE